jgi:hypothetical protein
VIGGRPGRAEHWFECEDYGVVDRLATESIVTEFFTVGLPIWPSRSVYRYTADDQERRIEIPLDRRSVALGYLRAPTWVAAVVCATPAFADFSRWGHLLALALALAALASVLQFVIGRLDPAEADRRGLLRRAVGLGAPPELLPGAFRIEMREQLADRWYVEHRLGWREAIDRGMGHELLVALAEYHHDPVLVLRARTNLASDIRWN